MPKKERVAQLNIHMWVNRVHFGRLVYIDKSTFADKFRTKSISVQDHEVLFDRDLVMKKLEQVDSVYNSILKKELPGRLPDYPENWICSYCEFKDKWCDGNRNPLMVLPSE